MTALLVAAVGTTLLGVIAQCSAALATLMVAPACEASCSAQRPWMAR
jgi:hypothetical protein